jgi:hypothetical protein
MSRIHYRAALAACLAALAGTSLAQSTTSVKFTTSSTLMAGPTADAGLAACQPLRGDLAEITGSPQKAYGTEVFPLRVVSGRCAGTNGWAGASRIEVSTAAAPASSDALQFSSSDSLFESLTPKTVKASCQPLRGDGAQILESTRFAGTEVYRITVLSGRCQGTTGWVGSARLERAAAARAQ